MLVNYLRIALRNFRRQPGYTLLNILGLTLGIAATLFIMLYLTEELSYDKHHEKADRIYRISSDITETDDAFRWSSTQIPLAPQLKADYPEVEQFVRFVEDGRNRFSDGDRFFFVEKTYIVDSTVNDVFTFNYLEGDPATALNEPNSLVLSKSVADRIFGDNQKIGATLKTSSGTAYKVTGVYEDMPKNSHLIANAMFSGNSFDWLNDDNPRRWGGFNLYSYVLLKEGSDPKAFEKQLPDVVKKYVAVIFDQFDIKVRYELLPLTSIHLTSDFEGEPEPRGNMGFIYIFGAIALFILLLAAINYMNLATARATKRAMEVGIRKVLGSERWQLVGQFLSESILFTIVSLALSLILVQLLLPFFNSYFELQLSSSLLWSAPILLGALGIVLLIGIVGGSYPAFYLSAFPPIAVLKGSMSKGSGNPLLRKSLVIIQFIITLFMLAGTGVIYDQMNYLRNKDLGFNKDHILTYEIGNEEDQAKYPILRKKLLENPKIINVGTSSSTPGQGYGKNLFNIENSTGQMEQKGIDAFNVDIDYFPTLGVEMVTGRGFSNEISTDSTEAVLVNESMVKRMGWTDPIGKKVQFGTEDTLSIHRVIGVVKDFHQQSLYEPISALMFVPGINSHRNHVRINPSSPQEVQEIINYVKKQWTSIFPNQPFEYSFVDAAFMDLYKTDQIRARIFSVFSILMIIVACLGLIGLASFTAEQRTKEIGIRKILGASTKDLVYLLTHNFLLLAAIAALPAFLAAWYFMTQWLDTFAYHANLNYWLFLIAFVLTVLITLLMTGYHAMKAAWGNPIKALRFE